MPENNGIIQLSDRKTDLDPVPSKVPKTSKIDLNPTQ